MKMLNFTSHLIALSTLSLAAVFASNPLETPPKSDLPQLQVSSNGRFIETTDGQPFFWLADTAWELFHRLDREEAEIYLNKRAEQGFTVIQAVVLAELGGLDIPNSYGEIPLTDNDPTKPNEAYFEHVDWIVEKANAKGIYIGMLPTWGSYWQSKESIFTPDNANTYGEWLGERYGESGVIWILGGDRVVENETHRDIIESMAAGIARGDGNKHLMTFHPSGKQTSATPFHDAPWLDFNMLQSGHAPNNTNYIAIRNDYERLPAKPCLDGEPSYEYPVGTVAPQRHIGGLEVRRNAYWAVFSGAHGHTYGAHPIWQMYTPNRTPKWSVKTPWYSSMDIDGASQMKHLKQLMLSRPFQSRFPDQSLVVEGQGEGIEHIAATRDGTPSEADATYAMFYIPSPREISVRTDVFSTKNLIAWWYNPTTGEATHITTTPMHPTSVFNTPDIEYEDEFDSHPDWILIIEDASKT